LFLGDCHTWNPHNKKGNRENQDFVDLNDDVLAANDGAWDRPPRKVVWNSQQMERASELLEDNRGESPLGFKDPRTLLVVDGWKRVFPEIQFVGVVRHPCAVIQSLQKRSDMPAEQLFHQKLDQVAGKLGLNKGLDEQRFYDGQLRTSNSNLQQMERALPWKTRRLYNRLLKRCV